MTPEEFKIEALKIKKCWYDFPKYDDRQTRNRMVNLMITALRELGYNEGTDIIEECVYYLFLN